MANKKDTDMAHEPARDEIETLAYQARSAASSRPCGTHPCDQEYPALPSRWCNGCIIKNLLASLPVRTCDCGAALTQCSTCAVGDYQAAHPECSTCCKAPALHSGWTLARGTRQSKARRGLNAGADSDATGKMGEWLMSEQSAPVTPASVSEIRCDACANRWPVEVSCPKCSGEMIAAYRAGIPASVSEEQGSREPQKFPPLLHELGAPSPWQPIQDKPLQAALGKLAEELAEAGAAVARCLIQGLDECEPVTKVPNRVWLENELADVMAAIDIMRTHYTLDMDRMHARSRRKRDHLNAWRRMLTGDHSSRWQSITSAPKDGENTDEELCDV